MVEDGTIESLPFGFMITPEEKDFLKANGVHVQSLTKDSGSPIKRKEK